MRARNIKPGFFGNEQLAEVTFAARILFVGLWCMADREGRLEDRPKRIKMNVFPADSLEVEDLLVELAEQDLIVRYEADGLACIEIPKFLEHQRPHTNEAASKIPPRNDVLSPKVQSPLHQGDKDFALNEERGILNPESKEDTSRRNGARVPSRHIDLVFEHWQTVHEHPQAKPTEKRRRRIGDRLKRWTLDELRQCIDGYKLSPFHMGANKDGVKYDDIELFMRSDEHVEKGIRMARDPPKPVNGGNVPRERKTRYEELVGALDGGE